MIAAEKEYLRIVDILLSKRADVNAQDEYGRALIIIAAEKGYKQIATRLISEGADVKKTERWNKTALHVATENGQIDVLDILIIGGADVNAQDGYGRTPMMIAAEKGHKEIATRLIEKKADINKNDKRYGTALYCAARNWYFDVIDALIDSGADAYAVDEDGMTPLNAAGNGYIDVVKHLITKGVTVNKTTKYEITAMMFPAENGEADIVNTLIEAGPKVNVEDERDAETALTFVREELVLPILIQSLYLKNDAIHKGENIIAELYFEESQTKQEIYDLNAVIERACMKSFTVRKEKMIAGQFEKLPSYETITDELAYGNNRTQEEKNSIEKKFEKLTTYRTIREKLLTSEGWTCGILETRRQGINNISFLIFKLLSLDYLALWLAICLAYQVNYQTLRAIYRKILSFAGRR